MTERYSEVRLPGPRPFRRPENPLPYDMNPNPEGITPTGWLYLTEDEARAVIANSPRRAVSQED